MRPSQIATITNGIGNSEADSIGPVSRSTDEAYEMKLRNLALACGTARAGLHTAP